jgi:LysR family transcriptional regulator, transcription activator of glutamate synthase operon
MDTRALRWFQLVADGVSVTEVSDLEGTTQSGVSRALARLEAEVGTPLLGRSGRVLRMTHAGVAFKRHVDAVMHELDDGLAAVHQLIEPETGTVTLSFQLSLGTWLVPDLIGSFRAEHPRVRFDLRPKRDELVTAVRARGEIDLELSTLRPTDPAVRWRQLTQEPLRLAVPAGHRLASRSRIAVAEAARLDFITIRPTSVLRQLFDELCTRAGFDPEIAFECDDLPTIRGFVAAGLGVAIVPATRGTAADDATGRLRYLELTDRGAVREIGMVWPTERGLLPAAELFRAHVTDRAAAGLVPPLTPID